MLVATSLLFFVMYFTGGRSNSFTLWFAMMWLLGAEVHFERATFYAMIEAKDAEIERLKIGQAE